MAAVLKTVDLNGFGGSNPSLSAEKWLVDIYRPLFLFRALNRALIFEKNLQMTANDMSG